MKKVLVVLLSFMLAGCTTLPGTISEKVSGFDNTKEITMEPAWTQDGLSPSVKLGLYRTSKMDNDKAILTAVVMGTHNFASKEPLQFNIDGEILKLDSIDDMTKIEYEEGVYNSVATIPGTNWSSKRFEIKKDLINKLINGKEVWVKVSLSQDYVEGKFSVDSFTCARPAFKNFYEKVWGIHELGGKE